MKYSSRDPYPHRQVVTVTNGNIDKESGKLVSMNVDSFEIYDYNQHSSLVAGFAASALHLQLSPVYLLSYHALLLFTAFAGKLVNDPFAPLG